MEPTAAFTITAEQRLLQLWDRPHNAYGWFATVDHKDLGIRYLFTAFCFLLIGGVEALLMRIQLARPEQNFLTPEMYDQIFSMHGITMIFWYAAPILSGFSVYLVPLMIGARDMAFPRLNAFTYWTYLLSGIPPYAAPVSAKRRTRAGFRMCPIQMSAIPPAWAWISTRSHLFFSRFRRPAAPRTSSYQPFSA